MSSARMPVLFLAHGAPPLLDDEGWFAELAAWAKALPRPRAMLMVSAHWEARPLTIGATTQVPLVYDYYGFPERYYQVKYPSPGAVELATRVRGLLAGANLAVAEAPTRGLDHGAFIPLMAMYPEADVPVLQVSMPSLDAKALFALGRVLAPLRDEGVLVIGSGFLTHNLSMFGRGSKGGGAATWAREFDAWIGDVVTRKDFDQLLDYRERAPGWQLAHPTVEHFVPVILAAGASGSGDGVRFPIDGFVWGSFTRKSVQFG